MAAGVPVLAANVGALKNIIQHGETGFLYQNAAEFTTFAERLAADRELRNHLGCAGQQLVAARYSIHHWADTIGRVLVEASANKGSGVVQTALAANPKSDARGTKAHRAR
jgi:glycosyltransferase involved in cell wall biosynthesis